MSPLAVFDLLFFAVFGQTQENAVRVPNWQHSQPSWTAVPFKIFFGIYMLVSVVVLINLLIAMMTDTYQRIQVNEWGPLRRATDDWFTYQLVCTAHVEKFAQALLGWNTEEFIFSRSDSASAIHSFRRLLDHWSFLHDTHLAIKSLHAST